MEIYSPSTANENKNRMLCREVVEKSPSTQSYLRLGDAYMAITEPERALEVYEQALKRSPRDTTLAAKMGKALQRTHQYGKAINYYKEAVRAEENNTLRYDMAELQMRLKTYDKAEKTVMQALQIEQGSGPGGEGQSSTGGTNNNNDLQSLMNQARFLGLLARIQERSGNLDAAVQTLAEVKAVRGRVLKRVQVH